MDLLLVVGLSLLLVLIIGLAAWGPLRIALGLPFILFFPGYTLIAALFPKKSDLDGIERIALSFGLSIAVVPLIGLILNYTPWGIRLYPILISLTLFILAMSIVAWYRRRRLPEEGRFAISINFSFPRWGKTSGIDKVLSIVLVAAILGALAALGYVIVTPKVGESFTEFYLLGLDHKAQGYPTKFVMNNGKVIRVKYGEAKEIEEEEGRVTLGIVNHEHEEANYRIELRIGEQPVTIQWNGSEHEYIETGKLAHEQKWEEVIGFMPQQADEGPQKAEFLLWNLNKESEEERYISSQVSNTSIDLWLNEEGRIKVVNEGEAEASYRVKIGQEEESPQVYSKELAPGKEWEQGFDLASQDGLEVLVYKGENLIFREAGAYLSLHLWIDVEEE